MKYYFDYRLMIKCEEGHRIIDNDEVISEVYNT